MKANTTTDKEITSKWARDLLRGNNFCVLDTETTGLDKNAQICQIAVVDAQGNTLLDTLVQPTIPISIGATNIHGITDEKVKNAPRFEVVFLRLLKAIGNRDIVVFNAEFDLTLIKQSLRPYDIQLAFPTSDRRGCRIFTNGGSIHCAMLWYSQWVGEWNSYHGNYKWQRLPGGDHSAVGDCRATLKVIQQMSL